MTFNLNIQPVLQPTTTTRNSVLRVLSGCSLMITPGLPPRSTEEYKPNKLYRHAVRAMHTTSVCIWVCTALSGIYHSGPSHSGDYRFEKLMSDMLPNLGHEPLGHCDHHVTSTKRVHIFKQWDEEMIVGIDKFLVVGGRSTATVPM